MKEGNILSNFNLQKLFYDYCKTREYKKVCKEWALILIAAEENDDAWIDKKFNEAVEAILENDKAIKKYVDNYWDNNRPFTDAEKSQYSHEMQIVIRKINESLTDIMNEERCNAKNDIDCDNEDY